MLVNLILCGDGSNRAAGQISQSPFRITHSLSLPSFSLRKPFPFEFTQARDAGCHRDRPLPLLG